MAHGRALQTMLADGATNPDPWVQDNDSHHLNIRQLYVEMGDFAEFTGPLKRALDLGWQTLRSG